MRAPGPVFAMVPADVTRSTCAVQGAAMTLTTYGLILAHEGVGLTHRLDPTEMLALGILMTRTAQQLGADPQDAMAFLRGCQLVDSLDAAARPVQHDAAPAH